MKLTPLLLLASILIPISYFAGALVLRYEMERWPPMRHWSDHIYIIVYGATALTIQAVVFSIIAGLLYFPLELVGMGTLALPGGVLVVAYINFEVLRKRAERTRHGSSDEQ